MPEGGFTRDSEIGAHALGRRIHAARRKRGFSQEALAKHLGFTQELICKWERGVKRPSSIAIERLAEAIGFAVPDLMAGGPAWDVWIVSVGPTVAPGDLTPAPVIQKSKREPYKRKPPPRPKPKCRVCRGDDRVLFGICATCVTVQE